MQMLTTLEGGGKNLPASYQTISRSISDLAELDFDPNEVDFEIDDKGKPWDKIGQLKKRNLLPTEDQLRNSPLWNEELGGMIRNCAPSNDDAGVFDILGKYLPKEKKIIIYTKLCHLTALSTGLNYEDIVAIVIAHEVSHAVTHIGRDRRKGDWGDFPTIAKAILEHFAQMYTRMYFTESGSSELVKVFEVLSEGQPEIYRSWLHFQDFDRAMLNGSLLWTRRYYQVINPEYFMDEDQEPKSISDNVIPESQQEEWAVQKAIDEIISEMARYRNDHPDAPWNDAELATLIGKRKEYGELLRKRDYLQ